MAYDPLSRRGFLQTTAASAAAARLPEPTQFQSISPLRPASRPRKISDNLFVLEDTCNVYLVKSGNSGLLIDFGSGAIVNHLPELGVTSIDWILHTHHHRDQAQGDHLATARHIPIAVPEHERQYFESAENFWRNRRDFELYYVRNDFFSLTRDVPVAALLRDYDVFRWKEHDFFVQPTPGHTPGSITLIAEIDGRKTAFSGDLMHSPGKVQTLYDMQYYYEEHEGVDLAAYSLSELIKLSPQLLCPSHGQEIADPIPGMQELITKLNGWFGYWKSWGGSLGNKPRQLTPHVIAHHQTMSCFYAIISNSGKALFLDYGGPSWNSFYAFKDAVGVRDRFRFIEHSIDNLRTNHGLKSIDVAIPSHMHDDHLNGFPYLARRYGTKIWCFENFVDILQNPRGHNLGCTLGEPIHIDRVIRNRETFRWEEFEFTAVHSPGHTNFQMALFAEIDGVRLGFTGDAFFHDADKPFQIRHNLIYRNRVKVGDHLKSAANLIEFKPQILCPGHGEPFLLDFNMVRDFQAKLEKQDAFIRSLVADRDTDIGIDPSWVELYPYQAVALPGETCQFEIRVRNHRRTPTELQVALTLPTGWQSRPEVARVNIPPLQTGMAKVSIRIPGDFPTEPSRVAIAADVLSDGRYLGQIAEAVIDLRATV
jgi:glyoxylase-like metal-dependent hydrolase (beta-lactamase superfamily II)